MEEDPKNGGNNTTALAKLLNQLNLPTLALILLTSGGNAIFTDKSGRQTDAELQQSIRQIHELHDELDTALRNQRDIIQQVDQLTDTIKKKQP